MEVIDYKCPSCGSSMVFDSATGTLSCRSCGRQDNIEQMQDPLAQKVFTGEEVKQYHCNNCGADLITEAETAATVCSFCGSSVVLADRLSGTLAPALVIPFAISKEEAAAAFRKWCGNGKLTPRGFMTADRIKGITGLYVPFWLYELHNDVQVKARATKVRTYRQGDYQITETQHYDVYRKIKVNYVRVPLDASEKMNDQLMDKLEPFPYAQLKDFKTPYLAGYIAEKYSYTDGQLLPRAKEKIQRFIDDYVQSTMNGYTTVHIENKQVATPFHQAEYALLPVWVVHYDYNRLEYTFAMNGQTGKVVGKPPLSKARMLQWAAGIAGISFVSLKLLSWAMGGGLW